MKKIFLSIFMLSAVLISLQAKDEVSEDLLFALSSGDAIALSNYFNDNIELVIGSINDVYSKQQGTAIVVDFFRNNKINAFQVLHKGTKENAAFAICTLKSGKNTYRVYVLVRKVGTNQLIQQLRIESSND